jgi:hypothetical protein
VAIRSQWLQLATQPHAPQASYNRKSRADEVSDRDTSWVVIRGLAIARLIVVVGASVKRSSASEGAALGS